MGPSKKNKLRFSLEKRTNTSRGKIIQNTDSVGATNLESSAYGKLALHSPKSGLTFQCTHFSSSPSFLKGWHFSMVPLKFETEIPYPKFNLLT